MGNISLFLQSFGGFIVNLIVQPVRLVVNEAFLVIEQRVDHNKPVDIIWPLGGVVAGNTSREAGAEETNGFNACRIANVSDSRRNVVENGRQSQLLLAPFALAVPTEVEAEASNSALSQPSGQPG